MSLKAFHIVFIAASTVLCGAFAAWCFNEGARSQNPVATIGGGAAVLAGICLLFYGVRFLKRARGIGFL